MVTAVMIEQKKNFNRIPSLQYYLLTYSRGCLDWKEPFYYLILERATE